MPKQIPLVDELLKLTEQPYAEYNVVLTEIRARLPLDVQVQTFQRALGEELPLTTARRAYRTAIRVACGQEDVHREYSPRPVKKKLHQLSQKELGTARKNNSEK